MKTTIGLTAAVVAGALWACLGPVTPAAAYPPDPDNAALLYYQAFLLVPQTDDRALTDLVANVANGATAPNDQVKEYVKKCQAALDSAVAATQLQHCHWGLRYSKGFSAQMPHLAQIRSLSRLILADARILDAEGNHRPALERCLTTYRLAGHVGDDVLISFLVSVSVSAQATKCVTDILNQMPADAGTLTWLKGQLATVPAATLTASKAMALEREVALDSLRPERVESLAQALATPGGKSVEEIRKAANEQVLGRAREYYSNFMGSVLALLSGQTPYVEAHAKLQELAKQMEQDAAKDPAVKLIETIAPAVTKMYVLQVRHKADVNALQAAIDLYIAKAGAGRLPQSLAAASPRDPYTGNEFKYETTAKGFVLRCGAKDFDKNEIREYRFTTAK
jgi:uncharacterized protein YdbL (DUF1318 family)